MVSPRFVKNTLIFYIFPSEYFRNFYRPSYKMPKDNYQLFKASIKSLGYNNQYLNIFLIVLFGKGMNVDFKKKKKNTFTTMSERHFGRPKNFLAVLKSNPHSPGHFSS